MDAILSQALTEEERTRYARVTKPTSWFRLLAAQRDRPEKLDAIEYLFGENVRQAVVESRPGLEGHLSTIVNLLEQGRLQQNDLMRIMLIAGDRVAQDEATTARRAAEGGATRMDRWLTESMWEEAVPLSNQPIPENMGCVYSFTEYDPTTHRAETVYVGRTTTVRWTNGSSRDRYLERLGEHEGEVDKIIAIMRHHVRVTLGDDPS